MTQGGLTTINVQGSQTQMDDKGNYIGSTQVKLDDNMVNQFKAMEHVRAVSPVIQPSAVMVAGKYQAWISITAMDMSTFEDFDFPKLQYGNYPTQEDDTAIVVGASAVSQFSDPKSLNWTPVNIDIRKQKVYLEFNQYLPDKNKKAFTLPMKNIAMMEQSNGQFDYNVYMDLKYFKRIYQQYCNTLSIADRKKALKVVQSYSQIQLNTDNINNVEEVQKKIEEMGFQSYSNIQFLLPLKKASENIQLILMVMGIIVMFASAISIANTMVMSIYERTKEIGIMKVLGCTIRDIRKLFLFEAASIGLFGGVIGIAFGYIASWAINKFGAPIFSTLMQSDFTGDITSTKFSIIPIYLPLMSLAISIGVGLLSGYFPARRATKIKAIEAMKTEN
jgi:ABC-type antimicrobial peptide transport system permease subunit